MIVTRKSLLHIVSQRHLLGCIMVGVYVRCSHVETCYPRCLRRSFCNAVAAENILHVNLFSGFFEDFTFCRCGVLHHIAILINALAWERKCACDWHDYLFICSCAQGHCGGPESLPTVSWWRRLIFAPHRDKQPTIVSN